jgi:hypothetical protein
MYARAIDEAREQLRELQREQWGELGLALVVMGLAVAATQVHRALALPLLAGGLVVGARGLRAAWLRWELVDRLAADRDAYALAEVRAYAARQGSMARRRSHAAALQSMLEAGAPSSPISAAAPGIEALARELDDEDLELAPHCAVACMRLVEDPADSPLLAPVASQGELQASIRQIRAGFSSRTRGPQTTFHVPRRSHPA